MTFSDAESAQNEKKNYFGRGTFYHSALTQYRRKFYCAFAQRIRNVFYSRYAQHERISCRMSQRLMTFPVYMLSHKWNDIFRC